MKAVVFALGAVLLAGAGSAALSAAMSPADAIKARQANYKKLGGAFKAIKDELAKGAPDKALIKRNADLIASLGPQLNTWFPAGTGPEAGVKTAAKREIWTNPAEFRKDADALNAAAGKLSQVAGGGDLDAIKAQFGATGQTCGACHKVFKVKD
jgi:cytochrome c556